MAGIRSAGDFPVSVLLTILSVLAIAAPAAAGSGVWTTGGPFVPETGERVISALAVSPDDTIVYCGDGNGSVFSNSLATAVPVAGFTGVPLAGTSPLSVTFTDMSTSFPASWNWSFGDGTWYNTTSAAVKNPDHTYPVIGTYTVNLTVSNNIGTDTLTRYGYITVHPDPVTADSSGLYGRPLSVITTSAGTTAGGTMIFAVGQPIGTGGTGYPYAITSVGIVLSETLGATELSVTDIRENLHLPDDRAVAGIISISPVAIAPSAIRSGTIAFAVSGDWLTGHRLEASDIVLMRFHDGAWMELPTTYGHQSGNAYYFTATTPGFSYFAIASRNGTGPAHAASAQTPGAAASMPTGSTQAPVASPADPISSLAGTLTGQVPAAIGTGTAPEYGSGEDPLIHPSGFMTIAAISGIAVIAAGGIFLRWRARRKRRRDPLRSDDT